MATHLLITNRWFRDRKILYHITDSYPPMLNVQVHDAIICLSWNTKDRQKRLLAQCLQNPLIKLRSYSVILWTQMIHSPQIVSIQDLLVKNPQIRQTMCFAAAFPSQSTFNSALQRHACIIKTFNNVTLDSTFQKQMLESLFFSFVVSIFPHDTDQYENPFSCLEFCDRK